MPDRSKYIIVVEHGGSEVPILFPAHLDHFDIWFALINKMKISLISAGMFEVGTEPKGKTISVWAGDKSTTLEIASRGNEDAKLIERLLLGPAYRYVES